MMWGSWGFHWIWMVVFWVAVLGLIIWAVARLTPSDRDRRTTAWEILDERYARGEIDDEEYRRRRRELDG